MQKFIIKEINDADFQADENCTATYIIIECGNLKVVELVEYNSYGLTMWEIKTKYTIRTLGPIGSGG